MLAAGRRRHMTMTARLHRAAAAALAALALASLPSPRGAAAADAAPLDGAETFRKELAAWATRYDEHLLAVMWGRTWKRIGQVSFCGYGDARGAGDKRGTPRAPDLSAARIPVRGM